MRLGSHKKVILGAMIALALMGWLLYERQNDTPPSIIATVNEESNKTYPPVKKNSSFDRTRYSLNTPTSPWVIVNKKNSLPLDYVPADLAAPDIRLRLSKTDEQMHFRKLSHTALKDMFRAAESQKVTLVFGSGYRSAALQRQFYNSYVSSDGALAADRYSARPGHSEHQTGLAADITSPRGVCHLKDCFKNTPQGKWIAAHAYKFGFIIRYPEGKETITGYTYEPWHLRFVGTDLAAQLKISGQTMEEFFDLANAANYD